MHDRKRVLGWISVIAVAASLAAALTFASSAAAGVYDSAVLADSPSMYWRLGEADGATTAADASGHGITLTYTSGALLDEDAGIQNETNTSLAGNQSTIASRAPAGVSDPGMFETWMRTNVPASTATVYYLQGGGGSQYSLTVGTDGLLHATIVPGGPCCNPTVTMVGPSSKPVTDGFWHYITVDFANWYIYVDLTAGPQGTPSGGFGRPNAFGSGSINLGGANFRGQLDEVAVYDAPLSTSRMSAHASAGGLGWDSLMGGAGEESAPPGCAERGTFWKGSVDVGGTTNYQATGALDYITTTLQPFRCATVAVPDNPQTQQDESSPATRVNGQTIRVKLNVGGPPPIPEGYYAEWGPTQYLCNATTTCWAMFFNFKLSGTVDDVCTISFATGQVLSNENTYLPKPRPQNACTVVSGAGQVATQCNPPTTTPGNETAGKHGWKVQHEIQNNAGVWVAYFLCDTKQDTPTHDTAVWKQIFIQSDLTYTPITGWPTIEGFNQGLKCNSRTIVNNCWLREGWMAETHSSFLYRNTRNQWNNTANAACYKDTSFRYDGFQSFTSPESVTWLENDRNSTGC